jgi:hypothetical protein
MLEQGFVIKHRKEPRNAHEKLATRGTHDI